MRNEYFLTDEEAELIDAIRNFKRSRSNCSRGYIFYLRALIDDMLELS